MPFKSINKSITMSCRKAADTRVMKESIQVSNL